MYVRSSPFVGMRGLGDAASVQAQIVAAANRYGVDPNFALSVAKQESGYRQTGTGGGTLKSSAGALGVMQLMPATAAGLGVDPNDEAQNIDGGVRLLSQLSKQFNGNLPYVLAGYNAGPARVLQYGGVPPYPETQNYVKVIMADYSRRGGSSPVDPSSSSGGDSSSPSDEWLSSSSDLSVDSVDVNTYDIGGIVLSQGQLIGLGLAVAGIVVVLAIL